MGTGYTRNDTSNNIADGNIINASDLDGEFDAVESAFNSSTGHTHDGTAAEGGAITVVGPVQDLVVSATEVKPKTTNTLDLGTSGLLYKDAYLQGNMYFRDTALKIVSSADGQLDIDADVELELVAPTVDIDASTALTVDTASTTFTSTLFNVTGSANITGDLDVDNININGNTIISTDTNGDINISPDGTGTVVIDTDLDVDNINVNGNTVSSTDTNGDINLSPNGTGTVVINTDLDVDNININGNTIISTDTNGNIALTPNGTGEVDISKVDIDSGAIDGTVIGASSAAAITGTTITGTSFVSSGDMTFGDNDKAIFGAGSDLQIYHDGSDSYVKDAGSGNLTLQGTNLNMYNSTLSKIYLNATDGGSVDLYHDNSKKLATTATGVDVTGTITSDGLSVDGTLTVNGTGGQITTDNDGFITSKQSLDVATAGGRFIGKSNRGELGQIAIEQTATGADGGYIRFSISPSGSILPTERMRIDSSGRVGIGTTSPGYKLSILENANNFLHLSQAGDSVAGSLIGRSSSKNLRIQQSENAPIEFWTNNTERMRIDSSGNVGIGTSSPSSASKLHILAAGTAEIRMDSTGTASGDGSFIRYMKGGTDIAYIGIAGPILGSTSNDTLLYSNGVNNMLFSTNGAERMRIDTSGSVGIGTASPSEQLHVIGDIIASGYLRVASTQEGGIFDTTGNNGLTVTGSTGSPASTIRAYTGGTERVRIDSSGNLLVGRTSVGSTGNGHSIRGGDSAIFSRDSTGETMQVARNASSGELIRLKSNDTTVGSIGTNENTDLYIAGGDTGLLLNDDVDSIMPATATGSGRDNAIDLGYSSVRFRNFYLSGGVYLGGTAAANALDDYEEGTWTPASGGGTPAGGSAAAYVKIGRSVTVMADVTFTGVTSPTYIISGLPFQVDIVQTGACIAWNNSSRYLSLVASLSTSQLEAYNQQSTLQNINDTNRLIFAVTYQTYS